MRISTVLPMPMRSTLERRGGAAGQQPAGDDLAYRPAGFATAARVVVGVQDGPDIEMGLLLALGVPFGVAGAGLGAAAHGSGTVGHGGLRRVVCGWLGSKSWPLKTSTPIESTPLVSSGQSVSVAL